MDNQIEIINSNGQLVVSSRQIAESFGKRHDHVLRDIEAILSQNPNLGADIISQNPKLGSDIKAENSALMDMFYETTYKAGTGKSYKEYLMNRDGFSLLVMGFTGKEAMEWKIKYINAFNEMEKRLSKPQLTPVEQMAQGLIAAQQLLAEKEARLKEEKEARLKAEQKTIEQEKTIEVLKPKADYTDMILKNNSLVTITQIAKDYGLSGKAMNKKLHEMKIIYNLNGQWLLYSKYQAEGYVHSETFPINHKNGSHDTKMNTKWTQKGRLFLYEKLKMQGIIPIIERKI